MGNADVYASNTVISMTVYTLRVSLTFWLTIGSLCTGFLILVRFLLK